MTVRCKLCGQSLNPIYQRYRTTTGGEFVHETCAKKVERQMAIAGSIIICAVVLAFALI